MDKRVILVGGMLSPIPRHTSEPRNNTAKAWGCQRRHCGLTCFRRGGPEFEYIAEIGESMPPMPPRAFGKLSIK